MKVAFFEDGASSNAESGLEVSCDGCVEVLLEH